MICLKNLQWLWWIKKNWSEEQTLSLSSLKKTKILNKLHWKLSIWIYYFYVLISLLFVSFTKVFHAKYNKNWITIILETNKIHWKKRRTNKIQKSYKFKENKMKILTYCFSVLLDYQN